MVDARDSMGGTESYSPSLEYKQRLDDDCYNSGWYSITGLFWIYRQEVSETDGFWKVDIDSVMEKGNERTIYTVFDNRLGCSC